jgi:DNA polymerase-4
MIVYIHVPGFYAAVEQADNPSLRGHPVIVGGDPKKRGTVTSASAEALRAGVQPGMRVRDALERCPAASLRPTRLQRYRDVSQHMRSLLWGASGRVEAEGLDGAYLETSAQSSEIEFAAELCVRLRSELGVAAVAGIGPTRFAAYLAARHPGASGIRSVERAEVLEFLAPFPVTDLWGLGPATGSKLAEHGIACIGDIQKRSLEELQQIVGRNAAAFRALACGQDRDQLRPSPRPKTLSQERTLEEPTVDLRTLDERLGELAGRLELMLERERRSARTVGLTVVYVDEHRVSRSATLAEPVRSQTEIREAGLDLLSRTQAGVRPVRRLRVQLSNLASRDASEDPRQLRLF